MAAADVTVTFFLLWTHGIGLFLVSFRFLQVVEADVIVHIVDVSSPSREKQENAVTGVLGEMGVMNKPRLTLWNKLDLLPEEEQVRAHARGRLGLAFPPPRSLGRVRLVHPTPILHTPSLVFPPPGCSARTLTVFAVELFSF